MHNSYERLVLSAVLLKSVEYNRCGRLVKIESGTPVTIDVDTNIGFINDDYIQLSQGDFQVAFLN